MKRLLLICLLVLVPALAAAATSVEAPVAAMDGRFSGFDAVGYLQRRHPSISPNAEAVSHWSAYYNVNPLMLVRLLEQQATKGPLAPTSIRQASRLLATLSAEPSPARLAAAIGRAFDLPGDTAAQLVESARLESIEAGLSHPQAETVAAAPAMDLPFVRPQAWQFNGVHTWSGDDDGSPMSSIDFVRSWSIDWGENTSGDWVSAAHDGEVTVYSSCFVQVQHESGWATRYYHLDNVQVETGQQVLAGDLLANYASEEDQALCSGGHSSGPHVHFALLRDGQYFTLQDMALSGYLVHPGETSYDSAHERMWLEKRGELYYAYDLPIVQEEGDNTIDYRYNGMWYSPEHDGHGLNVEITAYAGDDGPRKTVFVVLYTYDDDGLANFYVGNRDYERWRSDESMLIDILQTSGGDFTSLAPVDFENPSEVQAAGTIEIRFLDCANATVDLDLDERSTGLATAHSLQLVKLIGVPDNVCAAASASPPD